MTSTDISNNFSQSENWEEKVIKDGFNFKLILSNGVVERVNNIVYYDKILLKILMSDIINSASYKVDFKSKKIPNVSKCKLPNGYPMYENLEKNHNKLKSYDGTEIVVPELAYIIRDFLIYEDADSLQAILDYTYNDELIPIDNSIKDYNVLIDSLDNFDYDHKIHALKKLKTLCEKKKTGQYFDAKALQYYYSHVLNAFDLELEAINEINTFKTNYIKK